MSETTDFEIMIARAGPRVLALALLMADQEYLIEIIKSKKRISCTKYGL